MRATLFFRFIVLHIILYTVFRVMFFLYFRPEDFFSADQLAHSFFLGFRFDLRLLLFLLSPLVLLVWWFSPHASRAANRFWRVLYTVLGSAIFVFYIFDFGFYAYLNSRMNSAILTFAENPNISFDMVWQSYPVLWISCAFFAVVFVYSFLLKRFVFRPLETPFFNLPRWLVSVAFIVVYFVGLYGSVSQYPLRWSAAFFSHHQFLSHLSLNPVLFFADTFSLSSKPAFEIEKVKKYYPTIKEYLKSEGGRDGRFSVPRWVEARKVDRPLNVVVIVMESMAMSKTSLAANPLKPTPFLQKIANQGLLFTNYYSNAEGTARNMFSIMTSIPDVNKNQTSTRNPMAVDQKLIASAFKNYRKMYFLGGSASWANIRGIFSNNIEGIEIVEEGSFDRSKTDVWGISDLDLFIEADKVFSSVTEKQPFFAVIQSASFHRPYSIPKNRLSFKLRPTPIEALKEGGFYSQEQFDSLRFSDYSLGHFFELAKKKSYFKNTLFVITGDHGLPDDGAVNVSAGARFAGLERYHVPLIFVNPAVFPAASVDERVASHADLMTSAAALAGVSHENTTLGRNLFASEYDKERYSFVFNYYSEIGEFGLIGPRFYYSYDELKKGQLYDLQAKEPSLDVKDSEPEIFNRMDSLAHAHYEYSRYLLLNNAKAPKH